jgi:PAS domain-containing protein
MFSLEGTNKVLEFIVSAGTISGFLYVGWRMIIVPIRQMYKKLEKLDLEVLPVIQSLSKEFSVNSGKSIMDRILRIDDNTRLAELRSKLIASNLITTSMLEFDKVGNLTWANKAFHNLTGLDIEQLHGNGWFVSIDEADRERVWNLWKRSIDYNIPFESEFIIKNQFTNFEKKVKCIVFPHKSMDANKENPILGFYGTIVDIGL